MQKTINAKVKIDQKFSIIVWNIDIYCFISYYSSYITFLKVLI